MANNCLQTKLKNTVNNNSIERVGELKIHVVTRGSGDSSADKNKITLVCGVDSTIRTTNGGKFGTSFGTYNKESDTILANTTAVLYFSDGEYDIFISNKYNLLRLLLQNTDRFISNMEDYKYLNSLVILYTSNTCVGDVANIKNLQNLGRVALVSPNISGDITDFAVDSSLNNSKCYGDFTNILKNASYTSLYDLNSIIDVNTGSDKEFKGDVSQASAGIILLSYTKNKRPINVTWKTTRAASSPVIAFESVSNVNGWNFGDDLDAMLINQAQCSYGTRPSYIAYKTINVLGNRTSASDAAVATLKGNGFIIKVNGETL